MVVWPAPEAPGAPAVSGAQRRPKGAGKGPALWPLGWSESQPGRTHEGKSQPDERMA